MKITNIIKTSLLLVLLSTTSACFAQSKSKGKSQAIHPIISTYLGKITGKETFLSVDKAKELVNTPLTITDAQNNSYTISSYQFSYKRIGVTEDEETGKTSPQSDIVAERFTETPLPIIWQNNIKESLKKGEELYFFDIIAIDKNQRRFFAPDIKIIIE